ncbi:MAG: TetR/AcrR family transcriptional regulator [Solirubrobacterales bacterium]
MSQENAVRPPSGSRSSRPRSSDAARRAAKRAEIIETAVALFSERGYQNATMGELADRMGVTKPALYYYLGSKDKLLVEILGSSFDRLERALDEILDSTSDPAEWLRALILQHVRAAAEPTTRVLSTVDLTDGGMEPLVLEAARDRNRRYLTRVAEVISTGQDRGAFRRDIDPKVVAFGLIGMCSWVARWYRPGGRLNAEDVARTYATLLIEPILA